jgi:hypothetical protein
MANKKTTKSSVIKHMKENKLSSRETSHKLINVLIDSGILNKEELNSQMHILTVNKDWDIDKIQANSIESQINKALKPFPRLLERKMIMIEGRPSKEGYRAHVSFSSVSPKKKKKVKHD